MTGLKTIAAYVPDAARAERVFVVAAQIAAQQNAHLTGYYVMPPEVTVPTFALGRQFVTAGRAALVDEAGKVKAHFDAAGSALQVNKTWRLLEAGHHSIPQALTSNLRTADLVVLAQRDPEWADSLLLEHPEDIVMLSGRPVLMIPNAGQFNRIGRRVVVAWNDRREAARAVFDALPILQAADEVRLVWVNPEQGKAVDLPTADIAEALARHGVRCTGAVAYGKEQAVGDTLLNECSDTGADLLVMGAYGHARLREFVFGGATRHILKTMTIPVMLSH